MILLKFLILGLATWRLSAMFAYEEGPFNVFVRIRHLAGVYYDEASQVQGRNWFAKGLICPWCNSVWFGAMWGAAWLLWDNTWMVALPLAISGLSVMVERWNNG